MDVQVHVTDFVLVQGGHTRFRVQVQCQGKTWSMDRTYREFVGLDMKLRKGHNMQMRGVPFPRKALLNRFSEVEVEGRRQQLETYLQQVVAPAKQLASLAEVRRFLSMFRHLDLGDVEDDEAAKGLKYGEVLFFFEARNEKELSVAKGDIVVVEEVRGQWTVCSFRGEQGHLPSNYLRLLDALPSNSAEAAVVDMEVVEEELSKAPSPFTAPKPARMSRVKSNKQLVSSMVPMKSRVVRKEKEEEERVMAVAMHSYEASDETELGFKKGDRIVVYVKKGEWWQGGFRGKVGFFPGSYVALVDGQTPSEVVRKALPTPPPKRRGTGGGGGGAGMPGSEQAVKQIQDRIAQQEREMEAAREQLNRCAPGSEAYLRAFNHLEELRMCMESLKQAANLTGGVRVAAESGSRLQSAEDTVEAQLKAKISNQTKAVDEARKAFRAAPFDSPQRKQLETTLEEHEMLLQALYSNLQGLATNQFHEEETKQLEKNNELLVEMRKRIALQVIDVENARTELLNCGGSYEEKLEAKKKVEEQLMLLEGLQANMAALTSSSGGATRADARGRSGSSLKKLGSRLTMFSRSSKSNAADVRAAQSVHLGVTSSYGSPPSTSPIMPRINRATSDAAPARALPPVPRATRGGTDPPKPGRAPPKPGDQRPTPTSPLRSPQLAKKKDNRLVHSTNDMDRKTGHQKKKRRARIAHEADDEKSSMGAKKKFYCILCSCETFEPSPPPKPENCRNCKHEFQAHRLHQIKAVRLNRNLVKSCLKAQLSFFV